MHSDNVRGSIKMAFNLGVWFRQQFGDENIFDVGRELRKIIYQNLNSEIIESYSDDVIDANVDYLLRIGILGFIFSGICTYDEEVKNKIPILIESKIRSENLTAYQDERDEQSLDINKVFKYV
jgi:hypothetical protein